MGNLAEAAPLHRGDVVLVPFPFTDLTSQKVRPAIIVSPDPQTDDVLLVFVSSGIPSRPQTTEWLLTPDHPEFQATGLKGLSILKAHKLLTLHRSLVRRKLGHVGPATQSQLDTCLRDAVGLARSSLGPGTGFPS